jgi:hypothetical protein
MDNHRLNAFYDNLLAASSAATNAPAQIAQLQKDAQELKDIAQAYASAQMFLQFCSTAAIVYLAYKASEK